MDTQIDHPNEFPAYKNKVYDSISKDSSRTNIEKIHEIVVGHSEKAHGDTKKLLEGLAQKLFAELQ